MSDSGEHHSTVVDLGDRFTMCCTCGWDLTIYRMHANPAELWDLHLWWEAHATHMSMWGLILSLATVSWVERHTHVRTRSALIPADQPTHSGKGSP